MVLRAELTDNGGQRIISKHKRPEERETKTQREIDDPAKLKVLQEAEAIASEWVTLTRLEHVLDKLVAARQEGGVTNDPALSMEHTPLVINAMIEDVVREAKGEIVDSREARKAIGAAAARLFKKRVISALTAAT